MNLFDSLKFRIANRTSAGRIKYLKDKGAQIGKKTVLLCDINCFGTEPYLVEVGEDCLISNNISFFTHDGGISVLNSLNYFNGQKMDKVGRIKVGNNCFIGSGAKIMPGIKIGDNVIVGAGAIVTKDVEPNSIVAGVPAKFICTIDEFYQRNKNNFYPTAGMKWEDKKEYLLKNLD